MATQLTQVQQRASQPERSVWLGAHAGTGKTKVLVDRVLRLLLGGATPSSIMCITYTKAAAAEMQLRLRARLREWMQLDDAPLREQLAALLQHEPTGQDSVRARALFMQLLDDRYGLQMHTIHGFCQALLTRFPMEAGFGHAVEVLDEQASAGLLAQAKERLLQSVVRFDDDSAVKQAFETLVVASSDHTIDAVLRAFIEAHHVLFALWATRDGMARSMEAIYAGLDIAPGEMPGGESTIDATMMDAMIGWLLQGGKQDVQLAEALRGFVDGIGSFDDYAQAYLTQKGEPRKKLVSQKLGGARPDLADMLAREQAHIVAAMQAVRAHKVAEYSVAAMRLGEQMMRFYQQEKARRNAVDYDDLIAGALRLLSQPGTCEWVLSKLDLSVQHILIDEAQDTNPAQWQLTQLLVEELFQPDLYGDSPRTLFVVGDAKQSIYRFQGADPLGFARWSDYYRTWFTHSAQPFERYTLDRSFRSGRAVLAAVDAVCAQPLVREAIGGEIATHAVHRARAAGRVQLWPVVQTADEPTPAAWQVDAPRYDDNSAQTRLVQQMVATIRGWLDEGRVLPSQGRAVQAGDILILLRRRGSLMKQLSTGLQQAGVAVAGVDRIELNEHLAVQDIIALANWCLLPNDDLTLACVLKGPLLQCDEETLFALCYGREGKSVWQRVQERQPQWAQVLDAIRAASASMAVYEWLDHVLHTHGMYRVLDAAMGDEVDDVMRELLQQALRYESRNTPSLQGFVQWLTSSAGTIKRELEHGSNAVRIMTVHGAKGLQAPIVFLPDTTSLPTPREALWWMQVGEIPVAYAVPPGMVWPDALQQCKQQMKQEDISEYYRLLYVAMTRAEDELVVCGFAGGRAVAEGSWYDMVRRALGAVEGVRLEGDGLTLDYAQEEPVQLREEDIVPIAPKPDWWATPLPDSLQQTREIVNPSVSKGAQARGAQGRGTDDAPRVRGIATHKLLQLLVARPNMTRAQLVSAAASLMDSTAGDEQAAIITEVWTLRESPDLAFIFGGHAQAEVSMQRINGNTLIRAQVDCVVEQGDDVHIIDFKTGRDVPQNSDMISSGYRDQLRQYRDLLQPLYAGKKLRCWLLWTATATLMPVAV